MQMRRRPPRRGGVGKIPGGHAGKGAGPGFLGCVQRAGLPAQPPERSAPRVAFAKYMAGVFRRLDGQTPVTIGCAYEYTMEQCADDVDVMVYHGYQQTREAVRT
jgi:hypothetical protein